MGEVVCSVKYQKSQQRDLVLPDHIPVHQLVDVIALALNLPKTRDIYYELQVPEGDQMRRLPDSRTLQQAFILNGSKIHLVQKKEDPLSRSFLVGKNNLKIRLRENSILGRLTPDIHVDVDLSALDQNKVVSRRHAAITHVSYHYVIKDLDSHNGTFVNKIRLKKGESVVLHPGDRLCFGSLEKGVRLTYTV
jgi:pSer/pThr/pTyr-binding forkhead associated (FHA) protein